MSIAALRARFACATFVPVRAAMGPALAALPMLVLGALLLMPLAAPVLAQDRCENCGRVESIRTVTTRESWTPLGSVTPPARASDPDNQSGRVTSAYDFTSGNTVLLGSAGGAGYARRANAYERPRWEIVVRMDAGGTRTVNQTYEPALRRGERVRVYGTQLELIP